MFKKFSDAVNRVGSQEGLHRGIWRAAINASDRPVLHGLQKLKLVHAEGCGETAGTIYHIRHDNSLNIYLARAAHQLTRQRHPHPCPIHCKAQVATKAAAQILQATTKATAQILQATTKAAAQILQASNNENPPYKCWWNHVQIWRVSTRACILQS